MATVSGAVVTILVASFVIFAALSAAPGDPVAKILGGKASDAARAAMREELGLDDPLLVRYWNWLSGAVQGDFGTSFTTRGAVRDLVEPRLSTTFLLVVMAATLILVIGISLGVYGGVSRRGRGIVAALVGLGIAVPGFVAANFLIGVFAVQLGWFPTLGSGEGFVDKLWHLTLPAVALSIGYGAYVTQLTAAAVAEESDKEYVTTSRGRGVPANIVLRHHTLRNAALPVLTASGLSVAGLISGTVIIEQIFGVNGIGSLLIRSIQARDYAVVSAVSLMIVIGFVLVTTLIDLVQVALDPRERAKA